MVLSIKQVILTSVLSVLAFAVQAQTQRSRCWSTIRHQDNSSIPCLLQMKTPRKTM